MDKPLIGVVGPCAAGKTTLVSRLEREGYRVRHIAQEHSYVADMWERITAPQILVYLHVSYPHTLKRRQLNWTIYEYNEQLRRLGHAREHAQIIIDTDELDPEQVYRIAVDYVNTYKND